jgi:hypothetical protein
MAGTVGILNATDINIYIGGVKIANCENGTVKISREMRDCFTKDSGGWEDAKPGKGKWEMSGTSKFAFDATFGASDLLTAQISGTALAIAFKTGVTGDWGLSGTAYVDDFDMAGGAEESMVYNFHFYGVQQIRKYTLA